MTFRQFLMQRLRWDGDLLFLYVRKHPASITPRLMGWGNFIMTLISGFFFQLVLPFIILGYSLFALLVLPWQTLALLGCPGLPAVPVDHPAALPVHARADLRATTAGSAPGGAGADLSIVHVHHALLECGGDAQRAIPSWSRGNQHGALVGHQEGNEVLRCGLSG